MPPKKKKGKGDDASEGAEEMIFILSNRTKME